jgi:hypothetical protein
MEKTNNMPLWVFLAFSSINSRKGALLLIAACLLFTLYCLPWSLFSPGHEWVAEYFLIDDWSWTAMMVPVIFWYWMSLRWMDSHGGWLQPGLHKE